MASEPSYAGAFVIERVNEGQDRGMQLGEAFNTSGMTWMNVISIADLWVEFLRYMDDLSWILCLTA